MNDFDVIIIGAGNGGLTSAATLANHGANVCLLERHNIPGGCATSFCRGRFEFEVALHQLSGLGTEEFQGPLWGLFKDLNILDRLEFIQMNDLYRVVSPGRVDLTLRPQKNLLIEELQKQFPAEKEQIEKFIELVYEYFSQVISIFYLKDPEASQEKYPTFFKYALATAKEIMDDYLTGPILKLVISAYWTYQGLPPRLLSFHDLAATLWVYTEFKPYHIKGGSQALSNAIAGAIIEKGGTIRYNCGVQKILVENGGVKGVITDNGDEITAPFVISNASKIATYVDMIDERHIPETLRKELTGKTIGTSAFTIYMGLDCEPEHIGLKESTNFIFAGLDNELMYRQMGRLDAKQNGMLLTCYDLIDKSFSPEGACQIALVTLQYGDKWLAVPPHEYNKQKFKTANDMLETAEELYPDLRSHIEEIEVATPVTHMRYLGHPRGAIYGYASLIRQSQFFLGGKSYIKGLYNTGAWAGMGGFQPTLENGASTARAVLKKMREEA